MTIKYSRIQISKPLISMNIRIGMSGIRETTPLQ